MKKSKTEIIQTDNTIKKVDRKVLKNKIIIRYFPCRIKTKLKLKNYEKSREENSQGKETSL